ncbi:hypothetical protein PH562_18745 [Rhizobium sp. CNPSo 4062]|uniref:hypothetical protein n=1 Tax=Rhizobium sp. CNPSo 4062 TaxID=3021410 RepID=UPI00254DC720|nr:hypothetical protein [Rhizobium sp. CNPSo 4062]MDK4704298.1 hypothetical protein [Rhizobium sp. CNPSo 4062]
MNIPLEAYKAELLKIAADLDEPNDPFAAWESVLALKSELEHLRQHTAVESFQSRVQPWMMACFGSEISADKLERGDRFLEEALELLQSGDYPKSRAYALIEYVFGRDKGEPAQEVGGVMVTLAAYCLAHGIDMHQAGEIELARIWTKVEKIRAKQAAKPTGSALPIPTPSRPENERLARALIMTDCENEEDLIDMANVGRSLMGAIWNYTGEQSLLEDWSPAEDPAEIVGDLYNRLEESLACHRQAMEEGRHLAATALELAGAVDAQADDIGTGPRTPLVILRELVQLAEKYNSGKPIAPHGFCWLDRPVTVKGGDYQYQGQLLCSFPKDPGAAVRYIVRDGNNRLFIHNAQQCGIEA